MFNFLTHPFDDIANFIIGIVIIVVAFIYAWTQIKLGRNKSEKDIIGDYASELNIVKCSLERIEKENKIKDQQIASLQGQVNVLKEVPLVNIDTTLKEISKFNQSLMAINTKILDRLNSDAIVLARDTKSAASAVEHVRTDLQK